MKVGDANGTIIADFGQRGESGWIVLGGATGGALLEGWSWE
jgi:hypothetical protein